MWTRNLNMINDSKLTSTKGALGILPRQSLLVHEYHFNIHYTLRINPLLLLSGSPAGAFPDNATQNRSPLI